MKQCFKMKYETVYISSNCNQVPTAASWGKNNLICYASCHSILVYDPKLGSGGRIISTLVGHNKRVNSVSWLTDVGNCPENELVSGSAEGDVIIWTLQINSYSKVRLKEHDSNVNIVEGLYRGRDKHKAVVVSVSMDCSINILFREAPKDHFVVHQKINLGYSICVGLKLAFMNQEADLILACGLDNSSIELYTERDNTNIIFDKQAVLRGHEDWVRGLDFKINADERGSILLASSSQDAVIRLWNLNPDSSESNIGKIKVNSTTYAIALESVLTGHEGWIYSVNWNPTNCQLLSASIDKTMVIWEYDEVSNLWLEKIRVGEVGGNTLGFYGGMFSPEGQNIMAYSYHGAFHLWQLSNETWVPQVTCGGHFDKVIDLGWDPEGEYLMSVSEDETTRIHAPWKTDKDITWHEIARPQVHGYIMSSLAILNRYKFASGAEEKIVRIFDSPRNFVENFQRLCHIEDKGSVKSAPKGASVPSLGLSNKAVYGDDNVEVLQLDDKNHYPEESYFVATVMEEPPTEETLLQNTLWPESQKLYGHGFEIFCLAASPDGLFLASACKSTTPEHAAIILWETTNWKPLQKLKSHTLTVAQLQFSPDSKHLLSVSRDRRWSLFTKNSNGFELAATTDKKTGIHARIIWTCAWTHDSKYFATGSRDGKAVSWTINENKEKVDILGQVEALSIMELKNDSVTALAFAPNLINDKYLAAVGLEVGIIKIYHWDPNNWNEVLVLDQSLAHHLTVRKLAFRPISGEAGKKIKDNNVLQLASCGLDYSVRIYNFLVNEI